MTGRWFHKLRRQTTINALSRSIPGWPDQPATNCLRFGESTTTSLGHPNTMTFELNWLHRFTRHKFLGIRNPISQEIPLSQKWESFFSRTTKLTTQWGLKGPGLKLTNQATHLIHCVCNLVPQLSQMRQLAGLNSQAMLPWYKSNHVLSNLSRY